MQEIINRLSAVRDKVAAPGALVPEQVDALSAEVHAVWRELANRPWVTPVRLRLNMIVFTMDETRLIEAETCEAVLDSLDFCVTMLKRVQAR
jgi:hypothetical protein